MSRTGAQHQVHIAVDLSGMPVRVIITEGPRADCNGIYTLSVE